MSESAPAIVDIDGDGDLDFLVGEYFGWIRYFENNGNSNIPNYSLITNRFDSIYAQESRANPCFQDLDNDGDLDLVIGDADGYAHFYRNAGTAQIPDFVLEISPLVPYPPSCGRPELIDIDADGDLDLFGGYRELSFFRNIGTPDSFSFVLVDSNFASFYTSEGRASADFIDIDSDRDYDLFIGERYGRIWYYRNDGDSVNCNFVYVTDNFEGIDVGDYASPEFADIDGDGDYDLFVGSESYFSNHIGGIYFYENIGSSISPQFEFITSNYLTLDLGTPVDEPQLVDIDADNDLDLFADLASTIGYFENTGNSLYANFTSITESFQGISRTTMLPYFVDLDADGDYDLICGDAAIPGPPSLALYRNIGTPNIPNIVLDNLQFITNPSFWVAIVPVLADIDADEDYDLFISDNHGHFFYYRNDGSPLVPDFVLVDSQWQGIQFSYPLNGSKCFSFADLDEDGDLDLFLESPYQHSLYFYRNTGTPQSANMILENENFLEEYNLHSPCPYFADIDSDGDLDLFLGEGSGGIMFFRNITGEFPNITLTPSVPSITIPAAGGSFDFTVNVNNPFSNPFNFDAWTEVVLPTGRLVRPVLLRSGLTINAGVTISRQITQTVPGIAPAGNYRYIGNVGVFPDSVVDSDEFGFVKLP